MSSLAPFALATVAAALLALPVAPALYELRKRRDAAPLRTSCHDGRIENFAEAFQSRIKCLRPELEQCRASGELLRTWIDETEVLLVGCTNFDFHPESIRGAAAIMCSGAVLIPAGRLVEADVYADGNLELEERAAVRAVMVTGDIVLGRNSAVLRWLHADGSVYLRDGSAVYGRLTAGQSIRLEGTCVFEHMQAPQILTVETDQSSSALQLPAAFDFAPSGSTHIRRGSADAGGDTSGDDRFASSRPRLRVQGNFVLPPGETLDANVIATGELRFGAGSRFLGSAKSYRDTVVEQDASVHGSIICGGTIRLGSRCFVAGPLMSEGDIAIERESQVGEAGALTTVSSSGVNIAAGCQLHGTVWARGRGTVEA